jgi:hypothetical protein
MNDIQALAVPSLSAPVVSGHLSFASLDSCTPCAVTLLAVWTVLLDCHVRITEPNNLFFSPFASFHYELLPAFDFTAGDVAFHLGFIWHYFFLIDLTFLGLPAGCPSFFFCLIRERF